MDNGAPYFLVARRSGTPFLTGITLAEYKPGTGFVHEKLFPDSISGLTALRPRLVEIGDNSFIVFGQKFYRKVHFSPADGFTEEWARPLDYSLYFNNPSYANPPAYSHDPDIPVEFRNYLQGKWKDGTPLTVGGTGYNPGSTEYTDYVFPSNPPDQQGWSMCTANLPVYDQRMIASHGPFNTLPGQSFRIQLGFTLHRDIDYPCPDVFSQVQPVIQQIH